MMSTGRAWVEKHRIALAGTAVLACALVGIARPAALMAAWLTGWWMCVGIALGAQLNLWLHTLTGGEWGHIIELPLQRAACALPVLGLLMLPLLFAAPAIYPWAVAGWAPDAEFPAFKAVWLHPVFFVLRALAYLAFWSSLAWLSVRPRFARSRGFAAFGLLAVGSSASLASVDFIMSLMPSWYSSGFGLVVLVAQAKAALAWAVLLAGAQGGERQRRDLANLMLMYVLIWAALAFTQFLIVWAENLPREILWYVPRLGSWQWLGGLLIGGGFFLPLMLLLFRPIKQNPHWLRFIAALLLIMNAMETAWLVLPSIGQPAGGALWLAPLTTIGMGAILWGATAGLIERRAAGTGDRYGESS